jgi:hypothetical protein
MDGGSFQGHPKIGKENTSPPNGVSSTATNSHRVSLMDSNLSVSLKEGGCNKYQYQHHYYQDSSIQPSQGGTGSFKAKTCIK